MYSLFVSVRAEPHITDIVICNIFDQRTIRATPRKKFRCRICNGNRCGWSLIQPLLRLSGRGRSRGGRGITGVVRLTNRRMLMAENSNSGGYAADAVPATSRHVRNAV